MNSKSRKILLVAPLPPPFGGLAFIAQALMQAGLSDKFDVVHINTSKGSLTEKFGAISVEDLILSLKTVFRVLWRCCSDGNISHALILGTNGSEIVRIALYIFILRMRRVKILTNLHGTRYYERRRGLVKRLNDYVIQRSDVILSPTRIDLEAIRHLATGHTAIRLFYNSTCVPSGSNDLTRTRPSRGELRIIGIGRLSKSKGAFDLISTVIELLNNGYPLRLSWIGRGAYPSDDAHAEEIIGAAGPAVSGKIAVYRDIDDSKKYELLRQSDIFILPSYSDNLPISILEAMACGLPVISTRIGAIPEVIADDSNGWLFEAGDMPALKELIIRAVEQEYSLPRMGERNRMSFEEKYSAYQRIGELERYIS